MTEENRFLQQENYQKMKEAAQDPKVKVVLKDKNVRKDIIKQTTNISNKSGMASKVGNKHVAMIEKLLDDDAKLDKVVEKLNPDKQEKKKKPSVTEQLTGALLLMTPTLIGTAVGGMLAGSGPLDPDAYEGAMAGEKHARGLMESNQDMADQEENMEHKRMLREQQLNQQEQVKPLTTAQKVRAHQNIADFEQRDANRARLETQHGDRMQKAERGLNLKEENMRKLTPKQQENMVGLMHVNDVLNSVEDIINTRADLGTGPFVGAAKGLMLEYGLSDDMDFATMQQAVGLSLATNLKRYSGTAYSEKEIAMWKDILPKPADTPKLFREKLGNFRRFLRGEAWRMQQVQQASGQYSKDYGDPKKFEKQPHIFDKHKAEKNMSEMTPKQQELLNKYQ